MKTSSFLSTTVLIILYGCSKPHETSRILGKWEGQQVYEYEQTIIPDSAQTLKEKLGLVVQGTEVVQNFVVFQFEEDSAKIKNNNTEVTLWLIADEKNSKDFILVGDPTLSLTISKFTGDSLILDEQSALI